MPQVEPFIDEFAGNLVRLRGLEPADVEAIREAERDTEGLRRAGRTHFPYSEFGNGKWLEEWLAKRPDDDSAHLAIETLGRMFVGTLDVHPPDRRNRVFGYRIFIPAPHRGKGYGTDAVVLLLRFYFAELGYQKCDPIIYAFNEPSLQFHERLGFLVEGRRRRGMFTRGVYHDVVLVGMTREEFDDRYGLVPKA